MAETSKGKKVIYVHPYTRQDGTRGGGTGRDQRTESVDDAEPPELGETELSSTFARECHLVDLSGGEHLVV